MTVSTMFTPTDSRMPRKLIAAMTRMKIRPATTVGIVTNSAR